MRKLLIIPALNEASKIARVVKSVPTGVVDEICVIDDGSTDNTSKIAVESGAKVLRHEVNQGVGSSIRDGIDYAIKNNFDIAVIISGDDQHDANEIPRVLSPILNEDYDLVQGSRYIAGGTIVNPNAFRYWGIKIYTYLFRFLLGQKITDGTNGFRAFKTAIFKSKEINLWQNWLNRYELEPYLLCKVIKSGYRVKEVPVTIKYHKDGSYTKMAPFKGWWSLFRPILFLALRIRR